MESDDHKKICAGETKQNSDRGVVAGQQVGLPIIVSVQPASPELSTREHLHEDDIPED